MEGRNADADGQQQQHQHGVVGRKADQAHQRGRHAWSQNHEVAHAHAVGQVADEGREQAGQLREDGQPARARVADPHRVTDDRQQRRQKRCERVMDKMPAGNRENLARLKLARFLNRR